MQKHDYYQELCVLRANGELTPGEEAQLREHLAECPACREAEQQFAGVFAQLPAIGEQRMDQKVLRSADLDGFRQNFLARARREGANFSDQAEEALTRRSAWPSLPLPLRWTTATWAAASLLVGIALGTLGYAKWRQPSRETHSALAAVPAAQIPETQTLERRPPTPVPGTIHEDANAASEKLVASLKAQNANLGARLDDIERRLAASESQNTDLQQRLAHTTDLNAQLSLKLEQNAATLAEAKTEIEKARGDRESIASELSTQKSDVTTLSEQVRLQNAGLDEQRQLLAAGRDITDLMGARNLHMIDVRDADGTGKDRKAFGRVFYTEGKSLIFYAFDLDEKKLVNASYKFQAWGERLGQPSSVKSLGILYSDDKAQRRWVLKVDDPRQIAQIDSVFVTLEPRDEQGGTPRGKRILYAFLAGAPNHP